MAVASEYSSVTRVRFPLENWHQAEPLLETWKSLLQSLPGYLGCSVSSRRLENGDVGCIVSVTWEFPEQLHEFARSCWATETILADLEPKAYDVETEFLV